MLEHYLDQLGDMLHLCADTDGILIVNKQGVIEYHSMPMPAYYTHEDTVGKHILDIYPSLTEETSTILTVLRTGIPSYQKVQRLINDRGQNVTLESTAIFETSLNEYGTAVRVELMSLAFSENEGRGFS